MGCPHREKEGRVTGLQRYFLENPFDEEGYAALEGEDRKHIVNVMRMAEEDMLIAVSAGEAYYAEITDITQAAVHIQKEEGPLKKSELPIDVTIVCGLAKGDKHDWIVQKGTELGVAEVILLKAERSVVKWDDKKGVKKIERLRKIAKQAAEQSHRTVIPEIVEPITLRQLTKVVSNYDVLLVADEEDAKTGNPHRLAERVKNISPGQKVLVVFGPEGGLAREEVDVLHSLGFLPIALGPRILRTETAPLYVLSALSYAFE